MARELHYLLAMGTTAIREIMGEELGFGDFGQLFIGRVWSSGAICQSRVIKDLADSFVSGINKREKQ